VRKARAAGGHGISNEKYWLEGLELIVSQAQMGCKEVWFSLFAV
jgi:hypothetical protein